MPPTIDFQPYLRAIRQHCQQWEQLYAPTNAERALPQPPQNALTSARILLFEQMAAIVPPPKKELENRDEPESAKRETVAVLKGLREGAKERILLVGKPGFGKSTTLQRLLWEEAGTILEGKEARPIPVLVELRYCIQDSLCARIRAALQQHDPRLVLDDDTLQQELLEGNFLLLLDGLNELPSAETRQQIQQFLKDFRNCPTIGTTRDLSLGGTFGIEKQLEMLPLNDEQMQQFVRAYLPEQAEAMLRALQARSRKVGETRFEQTPLLLKILCEVFDYSGTIPANLGLLFREFTRIHEQNFKQDAPVSEKSRQLWQPLLTHLGEYMMQSEQRTEFRVAIAKTEVRSEFERWLQGRVEAPGDRAAECLEDLLEHSLLQVRGGNQIEFLHQLIQEYYAAEALLARLKELSEEELKRDYLNYLKWTEPVALMLALVGDETQAVRLVRLALEVDWKLGARLAGEVKREFQEKTVEMVTALEVPQWLKVELWGATRSDFAVAGLVKATEDEDFDVYWRAAEVLENLGLDKAIPALPDALRDEYPSMRRDAVEAVGKLDSQAAILGLLNALGDENPSVRGSAAKALGKIGSEAVIPALLDALKDENFSVRGRAADALGKIGSQVVIPALLDTLEDENFSVRGRTADALGKIGSQAAIPALLNTLEDENSEVRWSVVIALGKIGSQTAIPGLLHTLEDKNSGIRGSTLAALGKLGSQAAIPALLKALKDTSIDVRMRAVEVLEKLGSQAIPVLLNALENENSFVRRRAAEALGKMGSEAAIPALLNALKDENSSVRRSATETLGTMGSEAAIPALLNALKDENSSVRRSAAEALGEMGSEAAIQGLLNALKDRDFSVRQSTVEALEKIGSEAVIPGLLQALKDQNSSVCRSAVKALGKIGSQAAIPGLLQTLEVSYYNVCGEVAEALGNFKNDRAAHVLPHLLTLIPTQSGEDAFRALTAIQANCKFYNYDLFHSPPLPAAPATPPSVVNYEFHNTEVVTIVEQNNGEVIGKQISEAE